MWELPTYASVTSHVGDLVSGRVGVIVSLPVPSYNARSRAVLVYTEIMERESSRAPSGNKSAQMLAAPRAWINKS